MKKTNRTAWGLAAILAVALVGGTAGMLGHGVWLDGHYVGLRLAGRWAVGPDERDLCICDLCICGRSFDLGFIILDTAGPDPNCGR